MNSDVSSFFNELDQWKPELESLREILLECGLTEELKWGHPCYTDRGKNIILLGGFKEYCVISFIKGVFLNDSDKVLSQHGENSRSVRVIRFTNTQRINDLKDTIRAYIFEAIEVERAGLKVERATTSNEDYPEELFEIFDQNESIKEAFEALTPGRQRAYLMFFNAAKQSKTKTSRIESYIPRILKGKGMNDCVCGLSKRMPNCDGSHKLLAE
ncbi:MAG: YdeI/OmpD-associated family protein [Flavobacteriales bacterium]|nr:YdeI/OmpD-associated family protein [Flavobacteriales bacterium]MCB9198651.1 YdeI/OmpD-associated family protein [Flavobacteriales bacterium]